MGRKRLDIKHIYRKKVVILLVEVVNRNLGEYVIADNVVYLIQKALPYYMRGCCELKHFNYRSLDFAMVKEADLIIFCGGGIIKYKQEDFYMYVTDLLRCAEKNKVPVYFNGVGVEGYDAENEKCQRYERALNYSCIKGIGVRDDLDTLKRYLHSDHILTKAMIDPAVFTPYVYRIHKVKASNIVGLGIVRWQIFEDNGLPQVTKEYQLEMWKGIIEELERRGFQWKLFVNGMPADYEFAEDILKYIGRVEETDSLLVQRPVTGKELVENIASFAGIIACRMHANIIAYSLGIPSIGLVWNEKMVHWGNRIGYPERFLRSDQFEPKLIVSRLLQGMEEGVRPCPHSMKMSLYKPLKAFVRKYSIAAWKKKSRVYTTKTVNWEDKLVATALGGLELRWPNANSRQGLAQSLKRGFRNLEADIRLTTDDKLVCVNGWTAETYEMLGLNSALYDNRGLDYKQFCKCRTYANHYDTIDVAELLEKMKKQKGGWKLILDIGKPEEKVAKKIFQQIQRLCCGPSAYWKEHLLIRLQSKSDVLGVKEAHLPVQIMYHIPELMERRQQNETIESITEFCRNQKICWVSMQKKDPFCIHAIEKDSILYLKKQKLKVCVFTYNTYIEVKRALALGVDWIATSYLSVKEMESLYQHKIRICSL